MLLLISSIISVSDTRLFLFLFLALVYIIHFIADIRGQRRIGKIYKNILKDGGLLQFKKRDTKYVLPQDFSNSHLKIVWHLNKETGVLEDTGERIDIQEEIQSMKDYCLQACLERFECRYTDEVTNTQSSIDYLNDDLDTLRRIYDVAEQYRERYQLDDGVDIKDIFARMNEEKEQLAQHIQNLKNKKDGIKNEKTQENVAPSSSQGESSQNA